jgi:hypothetical protein
MFKSDLVLKAHIGHEDCWIVQEPLIWEDGNVTYVVPAQFETDLASVPAVFRWLLRVNGNSRRPAVLHDFLYRTQPVDRSQADAIFKRALEADGVVTAGRFLYWAGVRVGGWFPWMRSSK